VPHTTRVRSASTAGDKSKRLSEGWASLPMGPPLVRTAATAIEKAETLPGSDGDASLVYAGYPYDPFAPRKPVH